MSDTDACDWDADAVVNRKGVGFDSRVERIGLLFDSGAEERLWRGKGGGDSCLMMELRTLLLHTMNQSNDGILPNS